MTDGKTGPFPPRWLTPTRTNMNFTPGHCHPATGYSSVRRLSLSGWRNVLMIVLLLTGAASAQQKIEFKDHPFFKRLIGEWSSEGERKYADGNLVKVTETWKTELSGENAVTMEGTRDRAGQITHYKWTFTVPDAGLIVAEYQRDV